MTLSPKQLPAYIEVPPGALELDDADRLDGKPEMRRCRVHKWTLPATVWAEGRFWRVCFDCWWEKEVEAKGDGASHFPKAKRLDVAYEGEDASGFCPLPLVKPLTLPDEQCGYLDEELERCEDYGSEQCIGCRKYVCTDHFNPAVQVCDNCYEGHRWLQEDMAAEDVMESEGGTGDWIARAAGIRRSNGSSKGFS